MSGLILLCRIESHLHSPNLTDASSPFTTSQPQTPPMQSAVELPPGAQQVSTTTNPNQQDRAAFLPATLAQKLALHDGQRNPPSPIQSIGNASHMATPGTPYSDMGSDVPQIGSPMLHSHLAAPSRGGADSSDSSAFSSRANTFASNPEGATPSPMLTSDALRKANMAGYFEGPFDKTAAIPPSPSAKDDRARAQQQAVGKDRDASPSKTRPAVFSAIPPGGHVAKDKQTQESTPRPVMPEKKSAIGKMFSAMRSSDKLATHKDEGHGRPRGQSSVSAVESDKGVDSDSSAVNSNAETGGSSFARLSRKLSAGKAKEKDKEAFLREQAGLKAPPPGAAPHSDKPPIARESSKGKPGDGLGRRPSAKEKEGMGHSLKDFMAHAPLMHRKSSVTS